ncbi:MAG TPA: TetR/AcrR family transcriptional regulator [Firmicutes bacterium]|jgi:AcrR family transcriptional regulator|nr:TetR/AcrR family transcriptional regulator [Bacillota bacterium]
MNNAHVDRRVRKTKRSLRKALTTLLLQKDLKDISVMELTDLADVNRGTFYLHYRDIYDLYENTENQMLDEFKSIIDRHNLSNRKGVLFPVVLDAFEFLAENADICIAILRSGDTAFLSKLIEMSKPKTQEEWRALVGQADQESYEYYYAFITYGCVGLLRTWFMNGMRESPKEMAGLAEHMIRNSGNRPGPV